MLGSINRLNLARELQAARTRCPGPDDKAFKPLLKMISDNEQTAFAIVLDTLEFVYNRIKVGLPEEPASEHALVVSVTQNIVNRLYAEGCRGFVHKYSCAKGAGWFDSHMPGKSWMKGRDAFGFTIGTNRFKPLAGLMFEDRMLPALRDGLIENFGSDDKRVIVRTLRDQSRSLTAIIQNLLRSRQKHFQVYSAGKGSKQMWHIYKTDPGPLYVEKLATVPYQLTEMPIAIPGLGDDTVIMRALDMARKVPYTYDAVMLRSLLVLCERVDERQQIIGGYSGVKEKCPLSVRRRVLNVMDSLKHAVVSHAAVDGADFYFKWSVSSRGRWTPLGLIGSTSAKSVRCIIRFGEPEPLVLRDLLIGVATSWGKSKLTFDERHAFGADQRTRCESIGALLGSQDKKAVMSGWHLLRETGGKELFELASICLELDSLAKHVEDGGLESEFWSRLPYGSVDSTASGPQIIAAAMHSEKLMKLSNFGGPEMLNVIQDIYLESGKLMKALVPKHAPENKAGHAFWGGLDTDVVRACVKKQFVPTIYSGKEFSTKPALKNYVLEKGLVKGVDGSPVYDLKSRKGRVGLKEDQASVKSVVDFVNSLFYEMWRDRGEGTFSPILELEDTMKDLAESSLFQPMLWMPGVLGCEGYFIRPTYPKTKEMGYSSVLSDGKEAHGKCYGLTLDGVNLDRFLADDADIEFTLDGPKSKRSLPSAGVHGLDALLLSMICYLSKGKVVLVHDCFATCNLTELLANIEAANIELFEDDRHSIVKTWIEKCPNITGKWIGMPASLNDEAPTKEWIQNGPYKCS